MSPAGLRRARCIAPPRGEENPGGVSGGLTLVDETLKFCQEVVDQGRLALVRRGIDLIVRWLLERLRLGRRSRLGSSIVSKRSGRKPKARAIASATRRRIVPSRVTSTCAGFPGSVSSG